MAVISVLGVNRLAGSKEYSRSKYNGRDELEFVVHFEPPMFIGPLGLDDIFSMIQLPCQIQNDLAKQRLGLETSGNAAITIELTKGRAYVGCSSDINRKLFGHLSRSN